MVWRNKDRILVCHSWIDEVKMLLLFFDWELLLDYTGRLCSDL